MRDISTFLWCVASDFNAVFYMHEKVEGNDSDFSEMRYFCNAANDCELSDLGCVGEQMTWINGQQDGDLIMDHLDRFLHTAKWLGLFLFAQAYSCDF